MTTPKLWTDCEIMIVLCVIAVSYKIYGDFALLQEVFCT